MKQDNRQQKTSGKLFWLLLPAAMIAVVLLIILFKVNQASQYYQNRAAVAPTLTPLPTRMPTRTSPPLPSNWKPPDIQIPEVTTHTTLVPLSKPEDAISIVMNDPGFINTMDEFFFGMPPDEIEADKPIFVKAIDGAYPEGYYIVPFRYQREVVGLAAVGLQDGGGRLVAWSKSDTKKFPPVSREELPLILNSHGIEIITQPELVYSDWRITPNFRYGGNPNAPFWLVRSTDGGIYYIFYDYVHHKPLVYNPVKDQIIE